nr:hypothetical protein [Tanacetum cinerariifolium]
MEDTMFDLVKICHHKEFLCIHDDVDDLIESGLDSKLLSIKSINSQRLDKKEQEVKNVVEQPAERGNHKIADTIIESIPLPIPVQDGNSQQEEIDIETDDVLPPCDDNDDDLSNDSLLGETDLFLLDNSIPPAYRISP